MEEMYKSPDAELLGSQPERQKKRWKLFFFLILILEALSIVSLMADPAVAGYEVVLELLIYSLVILGLFGFAFHKALLKQVLWKLLLPVVIAYDFYSISRMDWSFESGAGPSAYYFAIAFALVVMLPLMGLQYYVLYSYGFQADHIWHKPSETG